MRRLLALAVLAMAAPAQAAPSPDWKLSSDGLGPITIGMTEAQATRALGARLDSNPPPAGTVEAADYRACHEAEVHGVPGLYMMFENGRLARVSLGEGSRIKTTAGLGIGDAEARVRRTCGAALKVEPHEYEEAPAHYLTVPGARRGRGVKFATNKDGVVTEIEAGGPSIAYTEGCA